MEILTIAIKTEDDVLLARQCAKSIAVLAGLTVTDQTHFITAISEILANILNCSKSGKIEFSVVRREGEQFIQVKVKDKGGKVVSLAKSLPSQKKKINSAVIAEWIEILAQQFRKNFWEKLLGQNQKTE